MVTTNCNCIVDGECICNKNLSPNQVLMLCDCDCECVLCEAIENSDNQQNLCACGNESCGCS